MALPAAIVTRGLLAQFERLLATNSRLRIDLRIGSSHLPGEGGIDLALATEPPPDSLALVSRKLGVHLRFRGDVPQSTWTLTGARGKRAVVKVSGAFECDDSRVLGDATYAGLGIGVRPEEELADAVKRKALVQVLPGWCFGEQPAYLLTTVGRRDLPRVRVVAEAVATAVRSLR
jgi:DNA-binding transcriptional LysR family regulator